MTTAERGRGLHGILLVDKPEGMTSAAVVAAVKRALGERKVGHLGTLDPFATGLLPVCLGEGTKLAAFLAAEAKSYVGEIVLGIATDRLDRTGAVLERRPVPVLAPADIARAVAALRGPSLQIPPMYSAIKRGGVPLYRLARAGAEVERTPRPIEVARFDVAQLAPDRLAFAVGCSKGTYVRSLAADLGAALGTGAHLASLRRTGFGPFAIADALPLARVTPATARPPALLSPSAALATYRAVVADGTMISAIRRGQQGVLRVLGRPLRASERVRIESAAGDLVAVVESAGETPAWRLARVIAP